MVTGAGRGLGRGIAKVLASAGARVWIVSEVSDELERTAEEILEANGRVELVVADLARESERAKLTRDLLGAPDRLRVLVNNAGILERRAVGELETPHWERVMSVNLTAPVFLTRDLLPALMHEGGSIINVSSKAGVLPFPGQAAYCASKFGLEAFTRCLALELAGSAVSANTVTPGLRLKPTSMTRGEAELVDRETRGSWSDPVELGPAFRFLAALRGGISGFRFDAHRLTRFIETWGPGEAVDRVHEVAEHSPEQAP